MVRMVELVGIEKLGILKTDKLLTSRESYNDQKASNVCKAEFIVRLLYGDSQSKQLRFHDKSDRNALDGVAIDSTTILASELRPTVAKSRFAEASTIKTQNNSATCKWTSCNHTGASKSTFRMPRPICPIRTPARTGK